MLRIASLVLRLASLALLLARCQAASIWWQETLIVAANQRILCQRLTKELVLVAQDINTETAKANLRATIQQFNTDLQALINGDSSRYILPASTDLVKKDLQKVTDSWADYEALLLKSIDTVRDPVTNAVNYTIITLALEYNKPIVKNSEEVVKLLVAESVVAGEDGSEAVLVDICERQLMLVHELNKEVVLVAMGVKPDYYLQKVLSSMQLFIASHEGILRGAAWAGVNALTNACILEEMRIVTKDWGAVLPILQMVITSPSLTDAQAKAKEIAANLTDACDQLLASMTVAIYSVAHGKTTCGDMKARVSAEEWLMAVESAEAQNYLLARATQLFMQIALGFEVSQSQVDLTVLTESVGQDLRKLIEGSIEHQLVVPPDQEIVDLFFEAKAAWFDLESELKKSVRSADIPSTTIKEVARLSRLALDSVGSAVSLYVKVALSSGTDAPVYQLDIASAQRTAIAKLAKETSFLSYGYDPQNSWIRFNYTRQSFVSNHWKLMKGYPASGDYPAVPYTSNICIVQQMAAVLTQYELMEIAALKVALGDAAWLQEVVMRMPEVVKDMELAMNQFSGLNTTCGPVTFSKEQWQGLITEVGLLRSWSQEAAVRFILQNEFNQTTVSLATVLQESEMRLKFGSRDPLVPPPISQAMFDEIAEHLEPKLHTLIAALAGSDSQQVHIASVSLSEETKKVKKEFLQDALGANPNKPVLRIDMASQQIMLAWQIFKESLMLKANLNVTVGDVENSIAVFESAQNNLKDGGNGIPAVIRNRFDIFKQWDQVMASWHVFKDLVLSKAASIADMQTALDSLVIDLAVALELYTIPDEPLRADTIWPIIAYSAIAVFVLFVVCCACLVFCSLRKKKKDKEVAEV